MLKRTLPSIAIVVMLLASQAAAQAPNVVRRESTATATVDRIERSSRLLHLKMPGNMVQTVYVDPSVRSFDELKPGDAITLRLAESVVVKVRPGAALRAPTDSTAEAQKSNENVTGQYSTVVIIDSIDSQGQFVVYRTADGMKAVRYVTDKRVLEGVRAGDRVEVTLTRERAVSIEPARR